MSGEQGSSQEPKKEIDKELSELLDSKILDLRRYFYY